MDPVDDVESSESVRNLRINDLVDVETMLRNAAPENDASRPIADTLPPESGVTAIRGTDADREAAETATPARTTAG